jgi:hypothetical protein
MSGLFAVSYFVAKVLLFHFQKYYIFAYKIIKFSKHLVVGLPENYVVT